MGDLIEGPVTIGLQHHVHAPARHFAVADLHGVLQPDIGLWVRLPRRDDLELGTGRRDELLKLHQEYIVPLGEFPDVERPAGVQVGQQQERRDSQAHRVAAKRPIRGAHAGRHEHLPRPARVGIRARLDAQRQVPVPQRHWIHMITVTAQSQVGSILIAIEEPDARTGGIVDGDLQTAVGRQIRNLPEAQNGQVGEVTGPVDHGIGVVGCAAVLVAVVVVQEDGAPIGRPYVLARLVPVEINDFVPVNVGRQIHPMFRAAPDGGHSKSHRKS